MNRISLAVVTSLVAASAFAESENRGPDKDETTIASNAWIRCQDFAAQKLVRAYGVSADPAAIADMVMAECYDFEEMVRKSVLGSDNPSDKAKILFADYKMEIHGLVTRVVEKLMRKR